MAKGTYTKFGQIGVGTTDTGAADISVDDEIICFIPAEHRSAVALALLGGITNDLVDALSKAAWDFGRYADDESGFVESARDSVRAALNAVFGIEP